jgi:hypothetical protein
MERIVPHLNRLIAAGMAALIGIGAAACGAQGASTGSLTASTTQAVATPSVAATSSATGDALPSGATDLEALIPDKVGKIVLQKASMSGDQFVGSGNATQEARDFLQGLGVSTDDVSVAVGFGADLGTGDTVAVLLFRALGANSDQLVSRFKEATDRERDNPLDWQSADLGGKHVEKAADPQQGNGSIYLYATGDLLVFVTAGSDERAAEALSALP